jgi:NAD(P)-dependent dehydrogenase (short-subunit alcohol dehydrogenase family)
MAHQATMTAVDSFTGKLAVVTGGGAGIGRELVRQLAAQGCSVATCDLNADTVAVTAATAWAAAPPGVQVTSHVCDVSDEAQVQRFRDELLEQHASDHVDLVVSNAGIFGGASFVKDSREEWERTFAINWWGVYFCARTFLPLLIASGDGILVNIGSVAGFWATAGAGAPITAYGTSEFAIKGFSEALVEDLRSNAPQVRVVVVMPGVVNTDIYLNSRRALGLPDWEQLSDAELLELLPEGTRATLIEMGLLAEDFSADDLRQVIQRMKPELRDQGFTAPKAAAIILDGVRSGAWRILVGEEAKMLDEQVRANPEAPFNYENYPEIYGPLIAQAQAEAEASGTPKP